MRAEDAYLFRHAVLREAAYQLQTPADREALHAIAADAIEAACGPDAAFSGEIADHLASAARPDLAQREAALQQRAARHAETLFHNDVAIARWVRAAQLLDGAAGREALYRAGDIAMRYGHLRRAEELLRQCATRAEAERDPGLQRRALSCLAFLYSDTGRLVEAGCTLTLAEAAHSLAHDDPGQATELSRMAMVQHGAGEHERSFQCFARALELQRAAGDRREYACTLSNRAALLQDCNRPAEAERDYAEALAVFREMGERRIEGLTLGNWAALNHQLGRLAESEAQSLQALAVHREVGNRLGEGSVLGNLAVLAKAAGRSREAREYYHAALAMLREAGDVRTEGTVLGSLANLHSDEGDFAQAERLYRQALAISRTTQNRRVEGNTLANIAFTLLTSGREAEGEAAIAAALDVLRETQNVRAEGVLLGMLAALRRRQGSLDEARSLFDHALELNRAAADRPHQAANLCQRALVHLQAGRSAQARDDWQQGASTLAELGDERELGRQRDEMRRVCAAIGANSLE